MASSYGIFRDSASFVPNWEQKEKSELFWMYMKEDNELEAESILSALICKYWYMTTYYYKRGRNYGISYEDCVCIVIDAILKATKVEAFKDPNSSLSKNERGPEIVINQCLKSIFLNKIRSEVRRDKRVAIVSDEDIDLIADENNEDDTYDSASDIVKKYLESKEYFKALVIDGICFQPIDIIEKNELKMSRLIAYIKRIDVEETCNYFKDSYDMRDVKSFSESLKNIANIRERYVRGSVLDVIDAIKKDIKAIDGNLIFKSHL